MTAMTAWHFGPDVSSGKDLAGIQNAVRIERLLDALHERDRLGRQPRPRYGAFVKPMPCSPLIDPSSATTPWNSSASASCARERPRIVGRHHDVDVDVAVADVAEARNPQREPRFERRRRARTARGMRAFGTTTSWLNLSGRDDLERRRDLAPHAPEFLALGLGRARAALPSRRPRGRPLRRDRPRPRPARPARPPRSAAARPCRPARARGRPDAPATAVERVAIDQLERRRHDARADRAA